MKNKVYILLLVLILSGIALSPCAYGAASKERQVKAAFIYNFIKFIDWPVGSEFDESDSITIGVVGGGDFIKAFDPIKSKSVKGRGIVIKQFNDLDELNELRKKNDPGWKEKISDLKRCQVLFICSCKDEKTDIPVELLKAMKASGVLVVGETQGFLENGGVINFIMESNKVRFEINVEAADSSGFKIRSQLLKLAKRVIRKEEPKDRKS